MSNILESMMAKRRVFRPENVTEYIALQLARKLEDADNILKYVGLMYRYSLPVIAQAYSKALSPKDGESPAAAFANALRILEGRESNDEL
jgi:hypothetical protein